MPKDAGIYKIENLVAGKLYIGSSVDIANRWRQHFQYLRNGGHNNRHLQRAWDKYGEENFKFEIIELCEKDQLVLREQYFIDHFQSCQYGYNLAPNAASSLGIIRSEETRKKIAAVQTGRKRGPHSEEHKHRISDAGKNIKKPSLSEEHKRKLSLKIKGKPQPRNRKPSPFKGKPGRKHTEKEKKKIALNQRIFRELRLVGEDESKRADLIRSMMTGG